MTGSENFYLRLNGFEGNAKIYWEELQTEKDFYDVTLACDDKQIKTHKLVISSCSPVLRNILKLNQTLHPIIYLRKVSYRNLQNLLDFMYQGEVNVAEEDLSIFLEFAEDLNVCGLSEGNTADSDLNGKNHTKSTRQNNSQSPKSNESKDNDNFNHSGSENNETNYHSSLIQSDIKQFSCNSCGKQYSSSQSLSRHNKEVHKGVYYSCDKCEYKASQMASIKNLFMMDIATLVINVITKQ